MGEWVTGPAAASMAKSWAVENGHFFSSPQWGSILQGLGCEPSFAWSETRRSGILVPVFARGPVRVGFLGFPVGASALAGEAETAHAAEATALAHRLRLDLIRSNRNIPPEAAGTGFRLPDVWLDKLQEWRPESSARLAKDLAHARRASRSVVISPDSPDPLEFHRLYSALIQARKGRVRYGAEYFARLFAEASRSASLVVVQARDTSGQLLGASVLAMDAQVGYYLHSALMPAARPMGVSDLLLERLIVAAQARGMETFNFMASPPGQAGLVRYKKKWGNRESVVLAIDVASTWLGLAAVAAIGWMARWRSRSTG